MSDNDSDNDNSLADLPSAAECETRCQRFAEVTGTDSALAMMFLQNYHWNLDVAVNKFYEDKLTSVASSNEHGVSKFESSMLVSVDPAPNRFHVLSWNIDGLSTAYLKQRTKAVVDTIKREKAEVVFLQEVVPISEAILRESLVDYVMVCAGTGSKEGYYCAMLLHKHCTVVDHFTIEPFHSSLMKRNLLTVVGMVKGLPVTLMTSHLESTIPHAEERIKQLSIVFKSMTDAPPEYNVIFGGDLNIRDKEMTKIEASSAFVDIWEATGRRKEAQYTWDTFRNDNLGQEGKWRSKLRFDRMFLRESLIAVKIKPIYFELVGLQRLPDTRCFPSDHWGILAHFDIVSQ